ncbi:probable partition-related protein [Thiobacillus denitrificans ATCC 25259]|uniref:Probable partition-related protein n=1 Tax=Thiobacillus denitrificans (strain ATCC 25259 / T1) TaxID=292415 RepID=Q3SFD0_THIDA|nr:ParA family protein [Thiobacillus denitrificans]AAZ98682.1 probable partition-related protein [Thiobacillus denitrificans ATCC 25259]
MRVIVVANPKGGSGKTTLSINLAGYLAAQGERVALLDMDRQKSATHWLAARSAALPEIALLREGQKGGSDWLVVDTPAALHGRTLERALKLAHKVAVPIAPSLFDIRASQDFLAALNAEKTARRGSAYAGVVGMRLDPRTRAGVTLEQFMAQQGLPVLACLRNTQQYVNAAFEGKSLFDLPPHVAERDLEDWPGLADWLGR